jgi:HK97 family phage major capsid protein
MDDKRTKEELLARLTAAKAEITGLNEQYQGQYIDPQSTDGSQWNSLNAEVDEITKTVRQMEAREQRIAELATDPANTDEGFSFLAPAPGAVRGKDIYDLSTIRSSVANPEAAQQELNERARRAVDMAHFPHEDADQAKCKEQVERLLATVDDDRGSLAQRILVTGSPAYKRAFGKALASPQAMNVPEFSAALSLGTDASGGYAVPFELDPTIIPTSNAAVNPFRSVSRVVQITGKEWDGVTSAGVTAHRRNEGDESADDAPTLAQPTVRATRVDVFIPFSVELQQDWGSLQTEMARLIQDAKDVEEASSFTSGNGTAPNPQGLLTGATVTVNTAGTATLALADLDTVEQALPPRFTPKAIWLGNRAQYNRVRALTQAVYDVYSPIAQSINQNGIQGDMGRNLHGYGAYEDSAMSSAVTSATPLFVLGDFSYFLIADRLGMSIELIPHLFGSNQRPTGQRGFYAVWRNNCKVLSAAAFRVLKAL